MADISYSVSLKVDKGYLSNSVNASSVTASMSSTGMRSDTYTLSGTPTNLSTANLTSVGLAFLRNLSTATATTCSVGVVSGGSMVPFSSPRVGEVAVLRLTPGATYQATGTSGARLRVDITEG
jgi:hypothetical protein